ncbi:MAG: hydantoinase B/oxoprolinase family protein [Rhodospirillaceae bacterium]|jgi:N-methylhydantoinase B|nr:hydantoinase B/oxoprolinase family protein [Rhodospirillaceae bacterium]
MEGTATTAQGGPTSGTVDPVTVQVLRNKVASLVDEMHYHFYRSGYSTIIRESRDFSCVILDPRGRLIIPPPMFFHGIAYRTFVENMFKNYQLEEIEDGDVFVSNHPYEAGMPHVSDMGFVAPIIVNGTLIGFSASIAHKADIGGTNPGSTSANSTEMYHEGLLLPPIKFHRRGEPDLDIERVILGNSRHPDLVRGDIHAQVGATNMGVARMKEHVERFGGDTVIGAFDAILDGAADELRKAIAAIPDGTSSAEGYMDDDGVERDKPVKFAATITIKGDRAIFDFSDSGPQAKGPVNLRPAMVEACVFYCLVGALGPHELHYNGGMGDVVDIVLAPDTVTNSSPPAPVSSYQKANLRLVDVILDAMSKFTPTRAIAGSGSSGSLLISWQGGGREGHSTMQYEIMGSAYGGGYGHDGCSATATHLSNLHITPIEILESEYPCRVTEMSMIPDSGGAGEFRGGNVFRRRYELLQDAIVVRRYEKAKFPAGGVNGGSDGRRSQFAKIGSNGAETPLEAAGRYEMKAGEGFYLDKAGGGGFGDPKKRDPDAIKRDIAEGYVTPEGAKRDYGFEG